MFFQQYVETAVSGCADVQTSNQAPDTSWQTSLSNVIGTGLSLRTKYVDDATVGEVMTVVCNFTADANAKRQQQDSAMFVSDSVSMLPQRPPLEEDGGVSRHTNLTHCANIH